LSSLFLEKNLESDVSDEDGWEATVVENA